MQSNKLSFEYPSLLYDKIIFIDGFWGSGKSLLSPILSHTNSLQRVRIDCFFEYISLFYSSGQTDFNSACWLLRSRSNELFYNHLIGRESNLRWSDDTGLSNISISHRFNLFARLFGREGDYVLNNPPMAETSLTLMSHMLLLNPDLCIKVFGNNLRLIEVVRHPCFVYDHYISYLSRFNSSREFTVSYEYKDQRIPYFAGDWADQFYSAKLSLKAVLSIIYLYKRLFEAFNTYSNPNSNRILFIPFENIIYNTNDVLESIQDYLDITFSRSLNSILRKQRIPRKSLMSGRGKAVYGWKFNNTPDLTFMNQIYSQIQDEVGHDLYTEYVDICTKYEELFEIRL